MPRAKQNITKKGNQVTAKKAPKVIKKTAPKTTKAKKATATTCKPTLTYFAVHGKVEPIRMLLSMAGVDFTDKTVDRD